MIFIIVLSLLVACLCFEIRDFVYNGGVVNPLAFGLFKISVILILMLMVGGLLFFIRTIRVFSSGMQRHGFMRRLQLTGADNVGENDIDVKYRRKYSF